MIRVLVVEDSPTQRHLTRAIVESDPEMTVVGEARNGEEAVSLCDRLLPNIITMDIQMPRMDGYEAIRRIMADWPRPILVLTSTRSDIELGISYRALDAGALMVMGKPHGLPGDDPEADHLIATLKALAEVKVVRRRAWLQKERPPSVGGPARSFKAGGPVRLIAMGASTGGPPSLQIVFQGLPADLPVPIVAVQHISRGFTAGLARWLDETTPLRVKVTEPGEPLAPGTVYLAPEGHHLVVTQNGSAWHSSSPPVDGHRPSVTALFESVAKHYGAGAIGVLLTGMGDDGARGLRAMHDAGAHTIAQDEASSVVFGMPREAIALGATREIVPLEQIAARLADVLAKRGAT